MIALHLPIVPALAFTAGCAVIYGMRRRARELDTPLALLALGLGMIVVALAAARITPDRAGADAFLISIEGAPDVSSVLSVPPDASTEAPREP